MQLSIYLSTTSKRNIRCMKLKLLASSVFEMKMRKMISFTVQQGKQSDVLSAKSAEAPDLFLRCDTGTIFLPLPLLGIKPWPSMPETLLMDLQWF